MAERGFYTPRLNSMHTGPELISTFDVDQIGTEALLFQTGYLTILREEQLLSGMVRYTLGYPNLEVEISLNTSLLNAYTHDPSGSDDLRSRLYDLLRANDVAAMRELFHAFFASIPHHWYANKYRDKGLPIDLIGVEFSREARNVVGFEVESIAPSGTAA